MYCKNCGREMEPGAAFCVQCGFAKGTGNRYCENCGQEMPVDAAVCAHCGHGATPSCPAGERKSKLAAGLLGIFLGSLGIHNFYLGFTGKGIAQLLITLFTCGFGAVVTEIWGLVEGILILTGSIDRDANGVPLGD